jgi:hypothetical protein
MQTSAGQAARIFQLRLKTGLPPAVIERNLEQAEREVAQQGSTWRNSGASRRCWRAGSRRIPITPR